MDAKNLVLLRHAKAAWPEGVADIRRPLAERGRRDARRAGQQLVEWGLQVDLVLCSPALRTRQTWAEVEQGGGSAGEVSYRSAVYAATDDALLALVRTVAESAGTVLVLGHGPGLPDLATRLAAGPGQGLPAQSYPTCGLTWLQVTGPWAALDAEHARLQAYTVPRDG